jgi:hypothetical protein
MHDISRSAVKVWSRFCASSYRQLSNPTSIASVFLIRLDRYAKLRRHSFPHDAVKR